MSVKKNVPEALSVTPRPCAFYQAAMHTPRQTEEAASGSPPSALRHCCLINSGKSVGPDGEAIGPTLCTPERQASCQAQRRLALARLYASLPGQSVAEAA